METRFYVIEIEQMKDGTTPKAIYEYGTMKEALQVLHQKMASAMSNANVDMALVEVLTSGGVVSRIERWEEPKEEPEQEEEVTP